MKLRDYQSEAINKLMYLLPKKKRVLKVLDTGLGKTEIAVALSKIYVEQGKKVCFVAHQNQLVNNAADRYNKYKLYPFVVQANVPKHGYDYYVASKPTLDRRAKSKKYDNWFESISLFIIDEAHVSISQTKRIQDKCPNAQFLLLTATPYTQKGDGLHKVADELLMSITPMEAVKLGYKLDTVYHAELKMNQIDKEVKKKNGDFDNDSLEEWLNSNKLIDNPVEKYRKYAEGKRTVVFCVSIKHAAATAEDFRAAGYKCGVIHSGNEDFQDCQDGDGNPAELQDVLNQFRDGTIQILCNVSMLTIGYDLPDIECLIYNFATKSLAKFLQCNRATRLNCDISDCKTPEERVEVIKNSKKPHAILIDLGGNIERHGYFTEPRIVSLNGIEKKKKEEEFKVCPSCDTIQRMNAKTCTNCDFSFIENLPFSQDEQAKERAAKFREAELAKITANPRYIKIPYMFNSAATFETLMFGGDDGEDIVDALCNASDEYINYVFDAVNQNRKLRGEPEVKEGWLFFAKQKREMFRAKYAAYLEEYRGEKAISKVTKIVKCFDCQFCEVKTNVSKGAFVGAGRGMLWDSNRNTYQKYGTCAKGVLAGNIDKSTYTECDLFSEK